jgi:hypothetical protein
MSRYLTRIYEKGLQMDIDKIEALLDTALEHASHGWHALEKETSVNRINPDSWPPRVIAPVGSAQYHLAAVIEMAYKAYSEVRREKDHTEDVMEKVNKALRGK